MRLAALRTLALSLPLTSFVKQWGENLVFKVAGKVFFLITLDGGVAEAVVFKCAPAEFDELTAIDGVGQAPYFAKRHWVRVSDPDVLPAAELTRRLRRSYALVAAGLPKKIRLQLGLAKTV